MGTQSTWGEQNRQYNKHNIISQTNIFLKMSGSRVPVTMRDFFFDDPFFKNSWEDFDKVGDAMFTESRDMWKKFDDDFRNMACMPNNIMLESDSQQQQQKAEDGRKMVSRMFSRKYTLPADAKSEEVASNLSSDGVLVITHQRSNLLSNKQDHETSKCINTYIILNLKKLNVYYTFTHFIFMP